MNYIDRIATQIATECGDANPDMSLYRIYAVLALVCGEEVENIDVHDAWSAWIAATKPDHRSLIPFDDLTPEVQELDSPYRDAIIRVVVGEGL